MGKIQLDQETGDLEITYGGRENPFMGIDSTSPDPYIGPGQLTQKSINAIINNNTILPLFFNMIANDQVLNATIIGYGDLNGQIFQVSIDNSGNLNIIGFPNFPSLAGSYTIGTIVTSSIFGGTLVMNVQPNTLTYKNVNGICYFSFPGCPIIFQHNNQSGAILTTYLGASFLSELNGRLIAANVWQVTNVNTNGYSPTNQTTGISASASNSGSQTQTSAPINTFPSQAVAGGQLVNVVVTLNGNFNTNPSGGSNNNTGSLQYQISKDSGVTWTTFQTYSFGPNGSNQSIPNTQITIPNISGLTNINTLQLRIVATVNAGPGLSTVSAVYGNMSAETAIIEAAPVITITNFPYQYAWSAPEGAYAQFNPLTTQNGVNVATGAGLNNLPDVEDIITGIFNTGPTQFILRNQGITEVSPLSNGINPFDFNHLWASHKGIGTIYPNTVCQYGSLGAFFADIGIFSFGYEGMNEVDSKASSAIYNDLIGTCQGNNLAAGLGPLYIQGEVYNSLVLVATDRTNNPVIYYWVYNFKTGEWYRFQSTHNHKIIGIQVISVNVANISVANGYNSIFVVITDNTQTSYIMGLPSDGSLGIFAGQPGPQPVNPVINMQAEEIAPLRDITIDGLLFYYKGTQAVAGLLQIIPSISNGSISVSFNTLNDGIATFDNTWRYIKISPANGTPFTANTPQFKISLTLNGNNKSSIQLGKLILLGSVDMSQRPL